MDKNYATASFFSFYPLLVSGQHRRFKFAGNAKPVATEFLQCFRELKILTQRSLQKNGEGPGYCDVPSFGLLAACAFVDQENIGFDFKSKADSFALASSEFNSQTRVELLNMPFFEPGRRRRCPDSHLGGSFRMLHLD